MKSSGPSCLVSTALQAITLIVALAILVVLLWPKRRFVRSVKTDEGVGMCGGASASCSAIDPVNEPDYNMRNVVRQSILLEEHLAESNKYCKSCIVKHFQHILGLVEEAVWLAGSKVADYPLLADSPSFYEDAFQRWLAARDVQGGPEVTGVLTDLRERRRVLIDAYFLKAL